VQYDDAKDHYKPQKVDAVSDTTIHCCNSYLAARGLGTAAALKRPAWQGERESATPGSSLLSCMAGRKGTLIFYNQAMLKVANSAVNIFTL
jgi:hypothetical protein